MTMVQEEVNHKSHQDTPFGHHEFYGIHPIVVLILLSECRTGQHTLLSLEPHTVKKLNSPVQQTL